jgi:hypothetical protein
MAVQWAAAAAAAEHWTVFAAAQRRIRVGSKQEFVVTDKYKKKELWTIYY